MCMKTTTENIVYKYIIRRTKNRGENTEQTEKRICML